MTDVLPSWTPGPHGITAADLTGVLDELRALRAEVGALRLEVATLRAAVPSDLSAERAVVPASPRPADRIPRQPQPVAAARVVTDVPDGITLHTWQVEALAAWDQASHQGAVEAITGSGKTLLGVVAARRALQVGRRVLVVVPLSCRASGREPSSR
jgi:hypothetical protein